MEMMGWGRGGEQEVKMSEKKEGWRKWKALSPHNVCFLSASPVWPTDKRRRNPL